LGVDDAVRDVFSGRLHLGEVSRPGEVSHPGEVMHLGEVMHPT